MNGPVPVLEMLAESQPDTIAFRLYADMRQRIRDGELDPGMQLRVDWLKSTYRSSTSPCREALARLAAEGFVIAEGKKGFRVRGLSRQDFLNINELRNDLECKALAKSIANRSEDLEERLLVALHRLKKASVVRLSDRESVNQREDRHRMFHLELLSDCGSSWLLRFYDQLASHAERYRRIFLKDMVYDENYSTEIDKEHQQLMDLVIAGDGDTATALIRTHRARTLDQVLTGIDAAIRDKKISTG